jgi:hypothetical protein
MMVNNMFLELWVFIRPKVSILEKKFKIILETMVTTPFGCLLNLHTL